MTSETEREVLRRLARIDKSLLLLYRVVLSAAVVAVMHFVTKELETTWVGFVGALAITLVGLAFLFVYLERGTD